MLKMTVKLHDSGEERVWYGTERDLEERLRHLFPDETKDAHRFLAVVAAVDDTGFADVEVEPYREPPERNTLPAGFATANQGDDPWPREGD